jgi:hypothetical protein
LDVAATFAIDGRDAGTTYYVQSRAYNSVGTAPWSASALVTTEAGSSYTVFDTGGDFHLISGGLVGSVQQFTVVWNDFKDLTPGILRRFLTGGNLRVQFYLTATEILFIKLKHGASNTFVYEAQWDTIQTTLAAGVEQFAFEFNGTAGTATLRIDGAVVAPTAVTTALTAGDDAQFTTPYIFSKNDGNDETDLEFSAFILDDSILPVSSYWTAGAPVRDFSALDATALMVIDGSRQDADDLNAGQNLGTLPDFTPSGTATGTGGGGGGPVDPPPVDGNGAITSHSYNNTTDTLSVEVSETGTLYIRVNNSYDPDHTPLLFSTTETITAGSNTATIDITGVGDGARVVHLRMNDGGWVSYIYTFE